MVSKILLGDEEKLRKLLCFWSSRDCRHSHNKTAALKGKKTYLVFSSYPRAALRIDKIAKRLPIGFKAIKRWFLTKWEQERGCPQKGKISIYRKVACSKTSRLDAHAGFFRLFMKGIFHHYVLWPFDKKSVS